MSAFSVLLLLSGAAAVPPPFTLPKAVPPEVAAERVRACGFDHVGTRYDRELDEDVIEVSGVSDVPEAKMRCAAQVSLDTVRFVIFPEPASKEYWRLYSQMSRDQDPADRAQWIEGGARLWLQERGLLDKVPRYQKGKSDNLRFARQLENVCGRKARGTLVLFHGHLIVRPGPPGKPMIDYPTFQCLFNAMMVSGMPFGFVGNEAYHRE